MNRWRWRRGISALFITLGIALAIFAVIAWNNLTVGPVGGGPPPADPSTVARVMASLPPLELDGVPGAVGSFCWDQVCSSDEGLARAPLVHSAVRVALPGSPKRVLGGMIFEPGDHWRTLTVSANGELGSSVGATYVEVQIKYQSNQTVEYVWRVK